MFFLVSKVFWLLVQPLSLILFLVATSLFCIIFARRMLAIVALSLALIITVLAGFSSIGAVLIAPLEGRFTRADLPAELDTILVLGGSTNGRIGAARAVVELNAAGDRLTEASSLARRYPNAKIVFSGGTGQLIPESESEAESAAKLFVALGIEPSRLVLEGQSRNTAENVAFTAGLLGESKNIALVTSAFHMPRSVGLLRAQGMEVLPWPVDYRSQGNEWIGLDFANPMLNLEVLGIAMREWIGLVAYRLAGKIDDVFPAQTQ